MALDSCKFGRYDYLITNQDVPSIQKQLMKALIKSKKTKDFEDPLEYTTSLIGDAVQALVADSFTECFRSYPDKPWNFTPTLFVMWLFGCVIRYCILLPIRAIIFFTCIVSFSGILIVVKTIIPFSKLRQRVSSFLFWICARLLTFSFGTVIKLHGLPENYKPG